MKTPLSVSLSDLRKLAKRASLDADAQAQAAGIRPVGLLMPATPSPEKSAKPKTHTAKRVARPEQITVDIVSRRKLRAG